MKKVIFGLLALATFTTACDDAFTENEPQGALALEEFFTTEDNAQKAIIGIYDLMQFNYARDWSSQFFVKMLPGDDVTCAGSSATDQALLVAIDEFRQTSNNPHIESIWNLSYRTISLANLVIDRLGTSNLSNKNALIAEAKFMRAWTYFELTTQFGDIPLRRNAVTTLEEVPSRKSSRADIYEFIKSDLTAAIAGMPEKGAVAQRFRFSKGAAQALMGKVLVFEGKHPEAIPFLRAVVDNPAHRLEPNVANVWSGSNEFGSEALVEIGYVTTVGYDWGNGLIQWGGRQESNLHIQLMGPRDGEFNMGSTGIVNGWGFNLPSGKLIAAFNANGDVARKRATLITTAELQAAGGGLINSNPYGYQGAIRSKYATRAAESGGPTRELNYGNNWILFRTAEAALLLSEAYIGAGGQEGPAREAINLVRRRAGLTDLGAGVTGPALFNAMANEKFLELAHEGQRFWDLVRWNRATAELGSQGYTSPKHNLYPIPSSEIEKNALLTVADQNPGY